MDVAALLLTGGASRRMGVDKATLACADGRTLARRTAELLGGLGGPAFEVGQGVSGLPAVADRRPGAGPLAAVADGVAALRSAGWDGPALVVATDLPLLVRPVVEHLAGHPAPGSVVPIVDHRPQWLCARYAPEALDAAGPAVDAGERAVRLLASAGPLHFLDTKGWPGGAAAISDADTPADLAALGLALPTQGTR